MKVTVREPHSLQGLLLAKPSIDSSRLPLTPRLKTTKKTDPPHHQAPEALARSSPGAMGSLLVEDSGDPKVDHTCTLKGRKDIQKYALLYIYIERERESIPYQPQEDLTAGKASAENMLGVSWALNYCRP